MLSQTDDIILQTVFRNAHEIYLKGLTYNVKHPGLLSIFMCFNVLVISLYVKVLSTYKLCSSVNYLD